MEEGETLLWSQAAPAQPAGFIHFLLAFGALAGVILVAWWTFRVWQILLPRALSLQKMLYKALSIGALAATTAVLAALLLIMGMFGLISAAKAANSGSAAYAITGQRALIVYSAFGAPYAETVDFESLRIVRDGNSLRFGQPLNTAFFGTIYDPAFYGLEDADRAEALLRRVARETGEAENAQPLRQDVDAEAAAAIAPALYARDTLLWAQRGEGRPYLSHSLPIVGFAGFFGLLLLAAVVFPAREEAQGGVYRFVLGPIGIALSLWAVAHAGWVLGGGHVYYGLTQSRVVVVRTEPWFAHRSFPAFFFDDDLRVSGDRIIFCRRTVGARATCNDEYLPGVRDADRVAALIRDTLVARPAPAAQASPN